MFTKPRLFLRFSLLIAAAVCAGAQPTPAPANPEWTKPFPPFKIIGNVYWVGTWDLSTYLIVTPQGNILINTGLAETVPLIKQGVEQLGFKLSDTKILTATHGHGDHVAGMAELKRMTGAKMVMSEQDADVLESGGKTDFRFGDTAQARFEPVKVDERLKDGGTISLGGTTLTGHLNPGHTKGATSFTFDVREQGKTYHVGIVNMGSINPGVKVSGMPKFPDITQAYARTFHDQKEMKIDIWLASHAAQFKLHDKYQPGDAYNPERFVDPKGFHEAVERLEKIYQDQLAAEQKGK
jgi:metallo-beta-lactamase class B